MSSSELTKMYYENVNNSLESHLHMLIQTYIEIAASFSHIDKEMFYKVDGYKNIYEFVKNEYGITKEIYEFIMEMSNEFAVVPKTVMLKEKYRFDDSVDYTKKTKRMIKKAVSIYKQQEQYKQLSITNILGKE